MSSNWLEKFIIKINESISFRLSNGSQYAAEKDASERLIKNEQEPIWDHSEV